MLYNYILNLQIKLTLRNRELDVQAYLVKKENLDVYTVSRALKAQLGPKGITSRSISKKQTLGIKAEALATIYKVEEIQDSKGNKIEKDLEPSQLQKVLTVPLPTRLLHQLTLLKLFYPIDQQFSLQYN